MFIRFKVFGWKFKCKLDKFIYRRDHFFARPLTEKSDVAWPFVELNGRRHLSSTISGFSCSDLAFIKYLTLSILYFGKRDEICLLLLFFIQSSFFFSGSSHAFYKTLVLLQLEPWLSEKFNSRFVLRSIVNPPRFLESANAQTFSFATTIFRIIIGIIILD